MRANGKTADKNTSIWNEKVLSLVVAILLQFWPMGASACSLAGWPWTMVNGVVHGNVKGPVIQRDSGSFVGGGRRGKPAFNLGNGRIGQVVIDEGNCLSVERLVLVDCNLLEMAAVDSVPADLPDGIFQGSFSVQQWLPPNGTLSDVAGEQIKKMSAHLMAKGARPANEIFRANKQQDPRNQFNPFAGCKRFYPKSKGAAFSWPDDVKS